MHCRVLRLLFQRNKIYKRAMRRVYFHCSFNIQKFLLPIFAAVAETAATVTGAVITSTGTIGTTIAAGTAAVGTTVATTVGTAATAVGVEAATATTVGAIAAGTTTTALNVGVIEGGKEILEDVVK